MASIEEVKAALMQATEQGNVSVNQIRAAAENTEQMLDRLRAIAAGTGHPTIAEAIARGEQSKQRLAEAMMLVQGSAEAARRYIGVLG
jgi:DNA-binding helix-hairpin-helix protein with protein kinase domain